jgi:hypothetical protein
MDAGGQVGPQKSAKDVISRYNHELKIPCGVQQHSQTLFVEGGRKQQQLGGSDVQEQGRTQIKLPAVRLRR